ncbi:hypothetical protein PO909_029128 [Leuciscus waleckii]
MNHASYLFLILQLLTCGLLYMLASFRRYIHPRLRWAFLEELEMENEEERRYTPIHRDHVSRMKRPASSPHVKTSIQKFVISSQ